MGYYQLCLVDRDRPCWNTDIRDTSDIPAKMAYGGQPGRGSDDDICGDLCSAFSRDPRGENLVGILLLSGSQYKGSALGKLQFSPALGFVCDQHILYGFAAILVYGTRARFCHHPGPGDGFEEKSLQPGFIWLDRIRQALAAF